MRLYGIALLERDETAEEWKRILEGSSELRDFLVEALIFAGNSQQLLAKAWPILIAEDGGLLSVFLKRFLHVATIPNPEYVRLALNVGATESEARTWERLPLWMYWLGTLGFLASRAEEVTDLAPIDIARIAHTWLRYTPSNWPGREDAARLALAAGQLSFRARPHYHRSEKEAQLPYKAALEAYPVMPDEVKEFALKASARIAPTEQDGEAFQHYKPAGTAVYSHSRLFGGGRTVREPWPAGPLYRVDETFKATCLETDALRSIMSQAPGLASEIILVLLIEAPKMDPEYDDLNIFPGRRMGLADDIEFYPRFYTRGPFLLFLRINPKLALETIIQLVDFATERWMEANYKDDARHAGIDLPSTIGFRHFIGDSHVYHWYHAIAESDIVASALMAVEKWLYERIDSKESVEEWISFILEKGGSLALIGMLSEVGRYEPSLLATVLRPLLLVPDCYQLEDLYARQGGHNFGTPFSLQDGEWFWKLAREWDSMKHRQLRLIDIAAYFFHQHEETRDALLDARERWRETLNTVDGQQMRHMETLIAAFDITNWKETRLPDGTIGLAFQIPEQLQASPEQVEIQTKHLLLLHRPIECRKRLDENRSVEQDKVAEFLNQAKALYGFEPDDPRLKAIAAPANAICGTIAVLVHLHRQWLRENPQEQTWCVEKLLETLQAPSPPLGFDTPRGVVDDTWEHFACEVIPVLWAEQPDNDTWRALVANLAMTYHYNAAGILMRRAFEKRHALGKAFWELVNLVLDWAAKRYDLRASQSTGKQVNISDWQRKAIRRFGKGKYSNEMSTWGETSIKAGRLRSYSDHPRNYGDQKAALLYRTPRVDTEQIQHTFANIFLPEQATDSEERVRFLSFWDQALTVSLTRTRFFDKGGNEVDAGKIEVDLPYNYDYWMLEKLAVILVKMHPDERPERYWRQILSMGPRAEHWVERFLYHWFMNVRRSNVHERFILYWQQMIEFCLSAEGWTKPNAPLSYRLPALWLSLIGISKSTGHLWTENDKAVIAAMDKYIVQVVPHTLNDAHAVMRLLSWLNESSSISIRLRLLEPLSSAAKQASDYWWKERGLAVAIARYLNTLWDEHRQELRSDVARRNFEDLLHLTAARHEPLALELQTHISSR